ncbi:MAG: putative membrane-anchored protein, partial [Paraglaciecola sp.]
MLFPAGSTPFEGDAWGVTIEYEEDGYVTDEDADTMDYSALLEQMKEDTALSSDARVQQGYD